MNRFFSLSVLCAALLLGSTQANAQKYGHMNLGNLLESLPAVTDANKQLQMVGTSFEGKLDSLEKDLQTYYTLVNEQANTGQLTRIQLEQAQKQLEVKQNTLKAASEIAEKAVADKRTELLEPILKKIEDAVKLVAKENNYLMIFDTSIGATLYVAASDDVTSMVIAKLK
jgi:outer membrane protein